MGEIPNSNFFCNKDSPLFRCKQSFFYKFDLVDHKPSNVKQTGKLAMANFSIAGGGAELAGEFGHAVAVPRTDLCVAGAQMGSVAYPRITDLHMI